jgi:hypothetical protein
LDCIRRSRVRELTLTGIVAYPKNRYSFIKGIDHTDSSEDEEGRAWTLEAKYIPAAAIGKEKVALFIEPKEFKIR